jgi:choline dehydrogenase-like flavoprotein
MRATFRLAVRALEWAPFPRRFSRLDPARRTALLESMERSRLAPRRQVVLLVKTLSTVLYTSRPEVQRAVGSATRCATVDGAPPGTERLEPDDLEAPEGMERCDVAIVGSGAGGAAAARALAERGLDVIVLEEGPYRDARSYTTDPLEALPALYRDGGLVLCEGRPAIPVPIGRCVGGTTVINSGTCLRAPDAILHGWRERLGIGWATDLDGEYESLERDLAVRRVDPARAGRNAELCRAGADALGAESFPIPRNAGDVVCCGTCPTGCAIDAKRAMHVSELPRAVAAGARIRAGARVRRVLLEGGRVAGVDSAVKGGGRYEVRARAVIAAGGAVGTPQLLLGQRLANASGALGRHLRIHPAAWVGALYPEPVRGWDGVMQAWHVSEWSDRGLFLQSTFAPLAFGAHWLPGAGERFKERVASYDRVGIIGAQLSESSSEGRVIVRNGRARTTYRLSSADAATLRFGIARAAEIHFAAGAEEVYPQVGRLEALRSAREAGAVENGRFRPSDLRLEAFHPMGTARMGADPHRTVVGPSGEAHDVPGLYLADASILPTSPGVNPMLTIMACSRRIAAGLADRLA